MTNKRPFEEWGFCEVKKEDYKKHKLEIDDILVTRTASLGLNTIIRNEISGVYNNGLIRLKVKKAVTEPLFIYCNLQSDRYRIYIERISGDSSTRPNMQINYLLDFKIIVATQSLQEEFVKQASLLYHKTEELILENNQLTKLRDALLPKLLSGELELSKSLTESLV